MPGVGADVQEQLVVCLAAEHHRGKLPFLGELDELALSGLLEEFAQDAVALQTVSWPADLEVGCPLGDVWSSPGAGGVGLYARVSSHDQRDDLDRQIARLTSWAADAQVTTVVVEHRDRLGRMNVELVEAALCACGRRLVVLNDGEVDDDLVRDMVEVLTSFRARLYGRRGARNRAQRALTCAKNTDA